MPVAIELRPSCLMMVIACLLHLCAIAGAFLANIPPWLSWLLVILVAASACRHFFRELRGPRAMRFSSGAIELHVGGRILSVLLEEQVHCSEWIQVLRFRRDPDIRSGAQRDGFWRRDHRIDVIVLPDSASAEQRRALRVALRWHSFINGVPV